jgi:hypothetical protein
MKNIKTIYYIVGKKKQNKNYLKKDFIVLIHKLQKEVFKNLISVSIK